MTALIVGVGFVVSADMTDRRVEGSREGGGAWKIVSTTREGGVPLREAPAPDATREPTGFEAGRSILEALTSLRPASIEARTATEARLRARLGLDASDSLTLLSDGRVHLVLSCPPDDFRPEATRGENDDPYIPWYLLGERGTTACDGSTGWGCGQVPFPLGPWNGVSPYPSLTPPFANLPWAPFVSAPYAFSSLPPAGLNPNRVPTNPLHSTMNVTRHWATSTVAVTIRYPSTITGLGAEVLFPGAPAPVPLSYTWTDLINDVSSTFAKYSGVATANIAVTTSVAADPYLWDQVNFPNAPGSGPNDSGKPPTTDPQVLGVLVWDDRRDSGGLGGYYGPTGNGSNDVIFLQRNNVGGTGGVCSMLVDPVTGKISEADVIFDRASFIGPSSGLSGSPIGIYPLGQPWNPRETTAYMHEIGHFFGMDHTNLHPGGPGNILAGTNPVPFPPFPPSLNSRFTSGNPQLSPGGLNLAEYPGMVGGVTATRNANHIMTPIHPDEAALLSVLYPVTTIAGGKLPLINTTATVQGRLVDNIKRPIYGQSCLVYSHPPSVGNILTPGVPLVGAMTGFHRFTDSDIVGIMDSATGAPSSGIFVVEGIPLPGFVPPGNSPLVSGLRFDVVWEGIECSGGGYGVPSEWVLEGYLNPPGGNTWPLSSFQTALVCNTNQQIGSLELSAGSVVDLSVVTHNGTIAVDAASRPLVEIVPRTTRPAGTTPVIVQVTTPNQLNTATASLTVNGVPFTNLAAYWQPVIGPPNWQWQIPANVVLPAGPALLRFSVAELQSSLPTGRSAVPAVNVVRY